MIVNYEIQHCVKGKWETLVRNHMSGTPITLESGTSWIKSMKKWSGGEKYRLIKIVRTEEVVFE
jgi:hypothetical protein